MKDIIPLIQHKHKPGFFLCFINLCQNIPDCIVITDLCTWKSIFQVIPENPLYPGYILCICDAFIRNLIKTDVNDIVPVDMIFKLFTDPDLQFLKYRTAVFSLSEKRSNHTRNQSLAKPTGPCDTYISVILSLSAAIPDNHLFT